eukprot:GHVU01009749.1.p1 GENE.GHVU01009749.1~~GHVU01009749.1.p1  ORF type:complete len:323 (-),score=53.11 GHVU01009749.1:2523-3491(-)
MLYFTSTCTLPLLLSCPCVTRVVLHPIAGVATTAGWARTELVETTYNPSWRDLGDYIVMRWTVPVEHATPYTYQLMMTVRKLLSNDSGKLAESVQDLAGQEPVIVYPGRRVPTFEIRIDGVKRIEGVVAKVEAAVMKALEDTHSKGFDKDSILAIIRSKKFFSNWHSFVRPGKVYWQASSLYMAEQADLEWSYNRDPEAAFFFVENFRKLRHDISTVKNLVEDFMKEHILKKRYGGTLYVRMEPEDEAESEKKLRKEEQKRLRKPHESEDRAVRRIEKELQLYDEFKDEKSEDEEIAKALPLMTLTDLLQKTTWSVIGGSQC